MEETLFYCFSLPFCVVKKKKKTLLIEIVRIDCVPSSHCEQLVLGEQDPETSSTKFPLFFLRKLPVTYPLIPPWNESKGNALDDRKGKILFVCPEAAAAAAAAESVKHKGNKTWGWEAEDLPWQQIQTLSSRQFPRGKFLILSLRVPCPGAQHSFTCQQRPGIYLHPSMRA